MILIKITEDLSGLPVYNKFCNHILNHKHFFFFFLRPSCVQGPLSSLIALENLPILSGSLRERLKREKVVKYGLLCESS